MSAPAKPVLCAPGIQEHSLCGMAFDAFETGDSEHPITFAQVGQTVTCDDCRRWIDYVRRTFRRYRVVDDL